MMCENTACTSPISGWNNGNAVTAHQSAERMILLNNMGEQKGNQMLKEHTK